MRYLTIIPLMCVLLSSSGCITETAEATPPQPEAYVEARARLDEMLREKLQEQTEVAREGNAMLTEIRDAIASLTAAVETHTQEVDESQQELIAQVIAEQAAATDEVESDPEPEVSEPDGLVTLPDGRRVDPLQFIRQHYKRAWTNPGNIREHMTSGDHGFIASELAGLDDQTLKRLHAAWHETTLTTSAQPATTTRRVVTQPRSTYYYPTYSYSSGGCPGGVCPSPRVQRSRRGLFGWR